MRRSSAAICTPGMALTVSALLASGELADEEATVRAALAGNVCRCTGYRAIIDAVRRARPMTTTPVRRPSRPARRWASSVARRGRRREAARPGPVRRRHRACPGCSTARCCGARDPTPRGSRSIDTSAALAMPGVGRVLTGADLRGSSTPTTATRSGTGRSSRSTACASRASRSRRSPPRPRPHGGGGRAGDRRRVRGAAGARARSTQALAPDAPLVHDEPARGRPVPRPRARCPSVDGNVCYRYAHRPGRRRRGVRRRGHRGRGRLHVPGASTSTRWRRTRVIAQVEGDEHHAVGTCQHPFLVRAEIAALFGVPLGRVRIIVPYLGGGFGSKSYTKMEPITVAARAQGRPAGADRQPRRRVDGHDPPARHAASGCAPRPTADGTLLAREVACWFDTGAYADNGPRVTATGGDAAPGPYRWRPSAWTRDCVYTNTAPSGSYRAFGAVAHAVGRRAAGGRGRAARRASIRWRCGGATCCGPASRSAPAASRSTPTSSATSRRSPRRSAGARPTSPGHGPRPVGGPAGGRRPPGLDARRAAGGRRRGRRLRRHHGDGAGRAHGDVAQIAAEVLGPARRARSGCSGTDTRFTPVRPLHGREPLHHLAGPGRAARRRRACRPAGYRREHLAARIGIELAEGAARCGASDDVPGARSPSASGFAGGELIGEGGVHPEGTRLLRRGAGVLGGVRRPPPRSRSTARPGVVHGAPDGDRARTWARPSTRSCVERQDEGATMQGIGNAPVRGDGLHGRRAAQRRPARVPHPDASRDLPARSTCVIVENADGPGPFGAKGCGEGALAGITGAIATAVADAGVPMTELPLTPERVWRRIQTLNDTEPRRYSDERSSSGPR